MTSHATAADRDQQAATTGGAPIVEFTGETPYDQYVHTMELHRMQKTRTDEPAELPFLVISQVMELYFGLIWREWQRAIAEMRTDDILGAVVTLRRSTLHWQALNATWPSLNAMTPMEFSRFRDQLGVASGFQSWTYRHIEFMMGLKSRELTRLYEPNPEVFIPLIATLESPSLYEEGLACLARAGYAIDADHLSRDHAEAYTPNDSVQAVWVEVYSELPVNDPLRMLGDVLSEISQAFLDWRALHLRAVKQSLGAKVGSGGSSGIQWLEKSMSRVTFDELWSYRAYV